MEIYMNIMSLTAVELGKRIKAKEISVEEAVTAALDAIEKKEKLVNSFVTVDREGALKRAKEVQKQIDDGTLTGPLAGVPVAIKDNMCTKDLLTTCSSKILYNFIPTYTAEAVLNLEKAGAVILGKTNMDEFAMGSTTETSAYGETKNPWNTEHVPGGSSGGSCAAVAAEECVFALGSDDIIHPSAEFLLRRDRNQADLRNGITLRTDRLRFILRSDRTGRKRCDRLCHDIRGDRFL